MLIMITIFNLINASAQLIPLSHQGQLIPLSHKGRDSVATLLHGRVYIVSGLQCKLPYSQWAPSQFSHIQGDCFGYAQNNRRAAAMMMIYSNRGNDAKGSQWTGHDCRSVQRRSTVGKCKDLRGSAIGRTMIVLKALWAHFKLLLQLRALNGISRNIKAHYNLHQAQLHRRRCDKDLSAPHPLAGNSLFCSRLLTVSPNHYD